MNIISGKLQKAQKTVIYGPEGVGKSTFASQFPNPLFIDTEGSTSELDVNRFENKPTSWEMLKSQILYVKSNRPCKTLVIDTMDWAERLCSDYICSKSCKSGIEDFGYGNGFTYVNEEMGRLLNLLDEVVDTGINVVITAHAQIIKFEQPDEMGTYDRWELKLGIKKTEKRTAALLKEWADMVLFANYKTNVIAQDEKGKKHKAFGGQRVMYTEHHPCWDAKNRHGLPSELPFAFSSIAHIFESTPVIPAPQPVQTAEPTSIKMDDFDEITFEEETTVAEPEHLPKPLTDLMKMHDVSEFDIREAVSQKGYFPMNTPISNYGDDFINGVLISAWPQVYEMIKANKNNLPL